jgi:antitoxin PrlF
MPELTVTAKGQITIRKALLDGLGVKPGDKLHVDVRPDGGLVIPPIRRGKRTWSDLAGVLKRPGQPTLTIEEIKEATERAWAGER